MYFKIGRSLVPSQLRCAMELIGGTVATNFKPMNAKALYERYCPPNGIIYDFSCGFGGRMLGALSSKNDYTYIGVEPCKETYENLLALGQHIESVTGRENSYVIHNKCSEDYLGDLESIDFAFSSPPYFNLERYSNEPSQCYNKFPTLDKWLEGYVRPTIRNTYKMLKQDGTYAVNIADFKINSKQYQFVDKWIQIAEEEGFTYKEQIHMKLETRRGSGHKKDGKNIEKKEGIFIFNK